MKKKRNYIARYLLLVLPLLFINLNAQEEVDPLETARLAKSAAEKAQAEAEAATEAAIQSAATKAASQARENAVQSRKNAEEKKIADAEAAETKKQADAEAAEEAELDALAKAAGDEARKKIAQELGLEIEEELEKATAEETDSTEVEVAEETDSTEVEEFVVKESLGYNVGFTGSVGFVNGSYITNTPVGGSIVLTTPFGFKVGPLDATVSLAAGTYNGEGGDPVEPLKSILYGVGVNATLFQFVFSETHLGMIAAGPGVRNFSGISLERIMKKGLNLPVNILVGGEGFITTNVSDTPCTSCKKTDGIMTYWGGLGFRLDYSF